MIERFAGRFVLLRRLGQGGMGEVFLARDLTTGSECALKRLAARGSTSLPEAVRREFEALTRVRHPLVVSVYELGVSPEGIPYCTMEYVPGVSADRAVARGDWASVCFVGAQVAHGLEALHAAGVVHGDLKPANIPAVPAERAGERPRSVRLLDFGLAVLVGEKAGGHTGTPGFAAPEVVRGAKPSPASDLYGLGATLFAIASGRAPFEADDVDTMLRRQQAGPPSALALEELGAPAALVQLILRLLSPDPRERPRDAREARRELARIHPAARLPLEERLRATVVVGRERELARLESSIGRALSPRPVTILVGDPGSGKSSLLGELSARASLAGLDCISLSCGALEGAGAVARALLRRLAADARVELGTELAAAQARTIVGEMPAAVREDDLDVLAEAGAKCANAIAPASRVVLVLLDDAERLDPLSAAWIRRLVCRPDPVPVRWVWARRPLAASDVEDEAVLVSAGFAERLELAALDRESVARLAAARLHDAPPEELVEFLWSRAAGHPGLTVELLSAAATAGAIREDDSGLRLDASALATVGIPKDFESSLEARHRALPAVARALAAALAIWGRALDPRTRHALAPTADEDAVAAIVNAGLVRRLPTGDLLLWPPAFGERVVRGMSAEGRRDLHRAALRQPGLSASERFRHLRGAGNLAEALDAARVAVEETSDPALAAAAADLAEVEAPSQGAEWHERAARLLMARRKYAAGIPHLERALELEPEGATRAERWAALTTCYLRSGRLDDTARAVEAALKEGVPEGVRLALMATDAARCYSMNRLTESVGIAHGVLRDAQAAESHHSIATSAGVIAHARLSEGRTKEAEEFARVSEEAYNRVGDEHGQIRSIGLRASIARARHRLEEAEALYRRSLQLATDQNNRLGFEESLADLGLVLSLRGQWKEAVETYRRMLRVAVEDGRSASVAIARTNLGYMAGLLGERRAACRQAQAGIRLCRKYRPRLEALSWRSLAQALRISGRHRAARRVALRALALADRAAPEERIWSRLELGRVHAAMGNWKAAGETWKSLEGRLTDSSAQEHAILVACLGRADLRLAKIEEARVRADVLDAWVRSREVPLASAHCLLLRAELALRNGPGEQVASTAAEALTAFETLSAGPDRAAAAIDLAGLAPFVPENAPPVMDWLDIAAHGFEQIGNQHGRTRALALMAEWLRRGQGRPLPATPDRSLIERVSWLLNSITDLRELAQRAMRMAVEQLDAERGAILLLDRETGQMSVIAEHGAMDATARNEAVGYSRRIVERVTKSGGALLVTDTPSDPSIRSESVVNLQLRSILCVPMFLGSAVVGAVYLDDSRRAHRFGEEDRGVLEGFAHLMAVAIEKARGHEEIERFKKMLEEENLSLRQEVGARFQYQNVVGTSSVMKRVLATVDHAARTNTTVLITGENGTGKELIARTLHHSGRRRMGPFVVVNCGAIPETLLESELFGILPNVATGVRAREGRFVQASGGTLLLDEVGEMPVKQQVALLSVIANREITPVGGGKPIPVDVRIIAATNRNLRQLMEQGLFREDLYYRLNVLEVEVPPVRERKPDVPALARHFLEQFSKAQEREVPQLSPDFMAVLMQSDWPGNVRELQNYIERVLAMNPGKTLRPDPLPRDLQDRGVLRSGRGRKLGDTVGELERRMVAEALQRAGGNQSQAARMLGLTEQSLRYRIRKYGLGHARHNQRTRQK